MASEVFGNLLGPEFMLQRKLGDFYHKHPACARVLTGSVATFSGLFKPFLLPILAAVGTLLMPILAGIKANQGDVEGTRAHLKAWGFCFLALGGTAAFCALTTFSMPLVWSCALVVSICALSVIMHVHKAMKEPCNI